MSTKKRKFDFVPTCAFTCIMKLLFQNYRYALQQVFILFCSYMDDLWFGDLFNDRITRSNSSRNRTPSMCAALAHMGTGDLEIYQRMHSALQFVSWLHSTS